MTGLDPFRNRQVPDVAGRFLRERDQHRRQASLTWTGVLVAMFSDHELRLLSDLGYLSQHDLDLLEQAGRGIGTPIAAAPKAKLRGAARNRT